MKTTLNIIGISLLYIAIGSANASGAHNDLGHGASHKNMTHEHHSSNSQKASVSEDAKYTVEIMAKDFRFFPSHLKLAAHKPTKIILKNEDAVEHVFLVKNHKGEDLIHLHAKPNSIDQGTYTLAAGDYEVICSVAGHTETGMVGSIKVEHEH